MHRVWTLMVNISVLISDLIYNIDSISGMEFSHPQTTQIFANITVNQQLICVYKRHLRVTKY